MKKLIIILVILLVLLAGGGAAAWFFLLRKKEEPKEPPPPKPVPAAYVTMEPLQVPIQMSEPPYPLLHMVLALEVPDAGEAGAVFTVIPRVRDAFLRELLASPVGRDGIITDKDITSMMTRLQKQADKVLGPGHVRRVLVRQILRG